MIYRDSQIDTLQSQILKPVTVFNFGLASDIIYFFVIMVPYLHRVPPFSRLQTMSESNYFDLMDNWFIM